MNGGNIKNTSVLIICGQKSRQSMQKEAVMQQRLCH